MIETDNSRRLLIGRHTTAAFVEVTGERASIGKASKLMEVRFC